jgi:3-oxoacyl-[acyl-carrier-protein] synthase-3
MINLVFMAVAMMQQKGPISQLRVTVVCLLTQQIKEHDFYPFMDGQSVFKKAIEKFPEVINEALQANGYAASDIGYVVHTGQPAHQPVCAT